MAHAQFLSSVAYQKLYTSHHAAVSSVPLCFQLTFTRRTSRHYLRNFIPVSFLPLSCNRFFSLLSHLCRLQGVKLARPVMHPLNITCYLKSLKYESRWGSEWRVCSTHIEEIGQVYNNNNNNNNNLLQLGCHPVAVIILHVYKTWNWFLLNLSREGYVRCM